MFKNNNLKRVLFGITGAAIVLSLGSTAMNAVNNNQLNLTIACFAGLIGFLYIEDIYNAVKIIVKGKEN